MASAKALGSGRATWGQRVGEGGGESAGEVRGQTPQDRVGYGEDLSSIQARWLGGHQGGRVAAEREVTGMTQMPCRRCRGDKTWDRKGRRQERLRKVLSWTTEDGGLHTKDGLWGPVGSLEYAPRLPFSNKAPLGSATTPRTDAPCLYFCSVTYFLFAL